MIDTNKSQHEKTIDIFFDLIARVQSKELDPREAMAICKGAYGLTSAASKAASYYEKRLEGKVPYMPFYGEDCKPAQQQSA